MTPKERALLKLLAELAVAELRERNAEGQQVDEPYWITRLEQALAAMNAEGLR